MTEEIEDERDIELSSITAIFPELEIDSSNSKAASLDLEISPSAPLTGSFSPHLCANVRTPNGGPPPANHPQETYALSHLPPLHLRIDLPDGYPDTKPPCFHLTTQPSWLPPSVISRLNAQGISLWEEYGRSQVVYAYIDYLQQEAERGFGLADDAGWELPQALKATLLDHDRRTKRKKFDETTFGCGVCLEPKKGSACYRLQRCGHVFCVCCLQDFYSSAITEGDIGSVKCMTPDCGKESLTAAQRRTRKTHSLHPTELLAIPLPDEQVQRYVDLRLKKKLESDKTTVYCPRTWCQGPAESAKWARFAKFNRDNLTDFPDSDSESEDPPLQEPPAVPNNQNLATATPASSDRELPPDRLSICSVCAFAFCRLCTRSWHGDHVNCIPRSTAEMTAEEQASYDYIRLYTSPCPTCSSPCQKTHGCNHMRCFQCNSHFCYLCSAWLNPGDPYRHFNQKGRECYMRLWELEEGDEGPENRAGREAHYLGARGAELAAAEAEAMQVEEMHLQDAAALALEGAAVPGPEQVRFVQWLRRRGVDEIIDEI